MRNAIFILTFLMSFQALALVTQPGPIRILGNTSSSVELAWTRSANSTDTTYGIFRNNYFIGTTMGLSYVDRNVRKGDSYQYSVRATDWRTISSPTAAVVTVGSYQVIGTPSNPPAVANPKSPSGVRTIENRNGMVEIAWNANGNSPEMLYVVFRNTNFIGITRSLSFKDSKARQGDQYDYSVKATNWKTLSYGPALTVAVGGTVQTPTPNPPPPVDRGPASPKVPVNGLPVSGNWGLEWGDEFDGGYGQKPGAPWAFDLTYEGGERPHRQAINTDRHAFLDGKSHLKMRALRTNGRIETSIIRTTNFQNGEKIMQGPPANLLLDPRSGPLYIETAVRFDKAYQSEDAWWAFWLFPPDTWDEDKGKLWDNFSQPNTPKLQQYDSNAQTGMEVDIFEYVPYLGGPGYPARNGFNAAAYIGQNANESKHMKTPDNGFVGDINRFLGKNTNINLADGGYHKIGMYWDNSKYEFFVDGHKVWEITDSKFITKSRANAMVLSWEVDNGLWGDDIGRSFTSNNKEVYVLIDYVKVFRKK